MSYNIHKILILLFVIIIYFGKTDFSKTYIWGDTVDWEEGKGKPDECSKPVKQKPNIFFPSYL